MFGHMNIHIKHIEKTKRNVQFSQCNILGRVCRKGRGTAKGRIEMSNPVGKLRHEVSPGLGRFYSTKS
jgi:hypothetical protein